jgi:hypothetical protein
MARLVPAIHALLKSRNGRRLVRELLRSRSRLRHGRA